MNTEPEQTEIDPDEVLNRRERIPMDIDHDPFLGGRTLSPWQQKLNEIIFGVDTPAGRYFDVALLVAILISVMTVVLESVSGLQARFGLYFLALEWFFTILFTIEYLLRLSCVERPVRYARSFFGIVDLMSIIPTYAAIFIAGSQSFLVIRALRLLRVFRVLKIAHCLKESQYLWIAFRATQSKILVFLLVVLTLILIMGSAMYLIEGPKNGFTSIPKSVYWAIVTMTTVGYGDIAPQTVVGQTLAAVAMILGYGIIIVPTGVFSVEVIHASKTERHLDVPCTHCDLHQHETDALYCKHCGTVLPRAARLFELNRQSRLESE
ncbi:ion transporter [Rubinisphaera margarita]|uniref:ion transporter n=1 Tax=Rubinisphaera margarita TaxID=2909586 RepID=UPI001EE80804|nr:ion transporter [Rubinisphaera margarita]MCG6157094.1 ion transporter [Rubinisphaera margarita]